MADVDHSPAPPQGEQIHMPAPSLLPIVNAVGLSLAIVSITISWAAVIIGAAIFAVSAIIWIVKAARDMDELPTHHH